MPRRSLLLAPLLLVLALIAGACSSSDSESAVSSVVSDGGGGAVTTTPAGGGVGPEATTTSGASFSSWEPVVSDARLLLNEIGFLPAPGAAPFVELVNLGDTAAAAAGSVLRNAAGDRFVIPEVAPLDPGGTLLIHFDGTDGVEDGELHAQPTGFLDPAGGEIGLDSADGELLDRVAWGDAFPDGVPLGRGGLIPDPAPGSTIGRIPSDAAISGAAWSFYGPDEATPGTHNPRPAVSLLLPLDGAEIPGPVPLAWYPVAGAVGYAVEVASDPGFAEMVLAESVEAPGLEAVLESGDYYWRVEAIGADGGGAGFSGISRITVTGAAAADAVAELLPSGGIVGVETGRRQAATGRVGVPLIAQHKDTGMLELQSKTAAGSHAWNSDHGGLDTADPSDNMNCALAATVMINRFYGGSLSQDRIGYEVLSGLAAGPETDLNYGRGLSVAQVRDALSFALGGGAQAWASNGDDQAIWRTVTGEIDAGRPLVGAFIHATGGHAVVISGYELRADGSRFLEVSDPWGPIRYLAPLGAGAQSEMSGGVAASLDYYFVLPPAIAAADDEPAVAGDSDGDGVVDFDETNRFSTDPGNPDSDGDGIDDGAEIRATVFDSQKGIAATGSFAGRDLDRDGAAMELDEDSDDGGCEDGLEDADGNGEFAAGSETHNFEPADDACYLIDAEFTATSATAAIEFLYLGAFVVTGDGSLLGGGDGVFTADDSATPCIDVDAGEVRNIDGHTDGSFDFEIDGEYRVGGGPAGRLPQPDDADPEFAVELRFGDYESRTVVSECELEDDSLFGAILAGYAENLNLLLGVFEGPLVLPGGGEEIPLFPLYPGILPGYQGGLEVTIQEVGSAGS